MYVYELRYKISKYPASSYMKSMTIHTMRKGQLMKVSGHECDVDVLMNVLFIRMRRGKLGIGEANLSKNTYAMRQIIPTTTVLVVGLRVSRDQRRGDVLVAIIDGFFHWPLAELSRENGSKKSDLE